MIGVDYDLFWTLNPKSLSPFIKAFELKQDYDDEFSWRLGTYIRMAIASSLSKDSKYPEKPFSYQPKGATTMTPEQIKEKMMATVVIINTQLEKEGLIDG